MSIVLAGLALALVAGACSQDPTQSSEYRALEAELEDRTRDLGQQLAAAADERVADRREIADLRRRLDEATTDLEAAQSATSDFEERLAEAEAAVVELDERLAQSETRAEDALAALEELEDVPWPDQLKALFVEGCAVDEQGRPAPESEPLCVCIVDQLEAEVSLVDFMLLSLLAIDPNAEVDPLTGLPADLDPELLEVVLDVAFTCALTA